MPTALITGSGGQDGVYLTRLLHTKGYTVSGIDLHGRYGEADRGYAVNLSDRRDIRSVVDESQPDEVYVLAAYQHSSERIRIAEEELVAASLDVNALALNEMLAAIAHLRPTARLLYASSSRVFGETECQMQSEDTPLNPVEPYGISKAAGMQLCRYWRRARNLFAVSAILYNHESPLRPPYFLSQKVVQAARKATQGLNSTLTLGDLSAQVDWGHAADAVRAMWIMLQQPGPADFVVATGQLHSVRDWLDEAFGLVCLDWHNTVHEDRCLLSRPSFALCGDATRLRQNTNWQPEFTFKGLVQDMLNAELARHTTPVAWSTVESV